MKRYEELEHTADWSFRAYGRDLKELYANAAYALYEMQGAGELEPTLSRTVQVQGIDREALMVNWLAELLFLQETRNESYQGFKILELSDTALMAEVLGAPAPPLSKRVKAVTYHGLKIEQTGDGWQAQVVVDV